MSLLLQSLTDLVIRVALHGVPHSHPLFYLINIFWIKPILVAQSGSRSINWVPFHQSLHDKLSLGHDLRVALCAIRVMGITIFLMRKITYSNFKSRH